MATVAASLVNGSSHPLLPNAAESRAYESIVKLRDDVLSGKHPRLKVHVEALPTSASLQPPPNGAPSSASQPAIPLQNGASLTTHPISGRVARFTDPPAISAPFPSFSQVIRQDNSFHIPTPASHGFDPVLLDKSPQLLTAERRLERGRIEKQLEKTTQDKQNTRPKLKIAEQDVLPNFDVDAVRYQAHLVIKPLSEDELKAGNGAAFSASSADDNTFYSSQVNDSATEDNDDYRSTRKSATRPCRYFFQKSGCTKGNACTFSHHPAFSRKLQEGGPLTVEADTPTADGYQPPPQDRFMDGPPSKRQRHEPLPPRRDFDLKAREVPRRSPDYSARTVNSPYNMQSDFYESGYANGVSNDHSPTRGKQVAYVRRHSGRGPSPAQDVQVVRNHVTSPLAPQPARISPLATARPPRVEQIQLDVAQDSITNAGAQARHQRIPHTVHPPLSRKRAYDVDAAESSRSAGRRRLVSPERAIKDEPTSPLPILQAAPLHRYVSHSTYDRLPVDVETYAPIAKPVTYETIRRPEPSDRPIRRVSSPMVVSQAAGGPSDRYREPDLRRAVSTLDLRNMALSRPQSVYREERPRDAREGSHTYPRREEEERSQSQRVPQVGQETIAYSTPGELAPAPRPLRSPVIHQRSIMAPPPARLIVQDQYGNQFLETVVPEPRRPLVAPEARYQREVLYAPQRPNSRLVSVPPEPARHYQEPRYVQLSPEPISPRYARYDTAQSAREPVRAPNRATAYERGGDYIVDRGEMVRIIERPTSGGIVPRGGSVAPREYVSAPIERRPAYYEGLSREPVYRMASVRPEGPLYARAEDEDANARYANVRPQTYGRAAELVRPTSPRYEYLEDGGREIGEAIPRRAAAPERAMGVGQPGQWLQ